MDDSKTRNADLSELLGKTLTAVRQVGEDRLYFETSDGLTYQLCHERNSAWDSEEVYIESVTGDWQDIIGSPLWLAEAATSTDNPVDHVSRDFSDPASMLWTFYRFRTVKGSVDIRWFGGSHGYYSVGVDFQDITRHVHEKKATPRAFRS